MSFDPPNATKVNACAEGSTLPNHLWGIHYPYNALARRSPVIMVEVFQKIANVHCDEKIARPYIESQ